MTLSQQDRVEVDRVKQIVIKPRWSSDDLARAFAVDLIARYGVSILPELSEISQRTDSVLTQKKALEWITKLSPPSRVDIAKADQQDVIALVGQRSRSVSS